MARSVPFSSPVLLVLKCRLKRNGGSGDENGSVQKILTGDLMGEGDIFSVLVLNKPGK